MEAKGWHSLRSIHDDIKDEIFAAVSEILARHHDREPNLRIEGAIDDLNVTGYRRRVTITLEVIK